MKIYWFMTRLKSANILIKIYHKFDKNLVHYRVKNILNQAVKLFQSETKQIYYKKKSQSYNIDVQFKYQQILQQIIRKIQGLNPMQRSPEQIKIQNQHYFQAEKQKILSKIKPVLYDPKDNKQAMIKYEGYMKIQKRKQNTEATQQYLESVYLRDLLNGKQVSNQSMQKFLKSQKIDSFSSNLPRSIQAKMLSLQEIQNLSNR